MVGSTFNCRSHRLIGGGSSGCGGGGDDCTKMTAGDAAACSGAVPRHTNQNQAKINQQIFSYRFFTFLDPLTLGANRYICGWCCPQSIPLSVPVRGRAAVASSCCFSKKGFARAALAVKKLRGPSILGHLV